jgi:hypothetical protein
MTTYSGSSLIVKGDIDTGRGQLGMGWSGVATTGTLWGLRLGANHYNVEVAAPVTLALPAVGISDIEAQPGYWTTIANVNGVSDITITDSLATTLTTITPGNSAMFVADNNLANSWNVQYNTSNYSGGGGTLQDAYDGSASTNPQIALNDTFGALKIRDSATPSASLLNLQNNAGNFNYFNVSNSDAGTQTPSISMLGGSVGAGTAGSIAIGPATISAGNTNAVVMTSTATTVDNCDNSLLTTFTNGQLHYGGTVREATGVAKTSPNEKVIWFLANNITTAGSTVDVLAGTVPVLFSNGSYRISVSLIGRDVVAASSVSVMHELSAMVTFVAGVGTVLGNILTTIETPGYTSITSNAAVVVTGLTLQLTINAPDNISGGAGGAMDFRGIVRITTLIE